jgi:hypothetical protein
MSNVNKNKENVNNQDIDQFNYFTLNKRVHRELKVNQKKNKIKTDELYFIMNHLACEYVTYKNGLVGVYDKLTQYQLAEELGINRGRIAGHLEKLVEMKFIKIFNHSPLVLQILEIPKRPEINDIKGLLIYVSANLHDFHFHINLDNRRAFFDTFKEYEADIIKQNIKRAEVPKEHSANTEEEIEDPFGYAEFTS